MTEPSLSPATPAGSEIPLGTLVDGRYRIDGILGAGGMGRVYRAEHTGIGRYVAIKMLHADLGHNSEAAARFQREAMASGRLDHPNIVGVSDFGVLDGRPYLVMEALEGESLGTRLERDRYVPWRDAVEIVRQVLQGLGHAHTRGVVHRDIKPDNIFLTRKDGALVVKILDFGIAKLYAGDPDDPMATRIGLTVGTPTYLSPEQAVGAAIAPPSDLYSATVVLYEMLAGRPPFNDDDPVARATAHVTRTPPPLADVAPGVTIPLALDTIIQRGLKKMVADRIATADDYLALLDEVAAPTPRLLHTPPKGTPTATPAEIGVMPTARFATPAPESSRPTRLRTSPGPDLPPAAGPVSIAGLQLPISRSWLKLGLAVGGMIVLIAIAIALSKRSAPTPEPASKPARHVEASSPVTVPRDLEAQLKSLLYDLQSGRTCADRKTAIPKLVELHDPRAIPALKAARFNMHGGVLGINQDNWNACLKADAEAAVKALGGTIK
ncbi:MAG TPA: protein kinase [Kofleriaceae bacterium]|nr:protein kinase [Kofleriaceae bacterium]